MFKIDEELTIHITRGDAASFVFSALTDIIENDDLEDVGGGNTGSPDFDPDLNYPNSGGDGSADSDGTGTPTVETRYQFQAGDVIRFKVMERKGCDNVVLSKDFVVEIATFEVNISLNREDTKIGEVISKPVDYWYEIELNPESVPQTIIGYDENGPKVFRLYPEGGGV